MYLVCHPKHFNVHYDINPWMTDNISNVNNSLAIEQWAHLVGVITNLSCVNSIQPQEGCPDMVFTANAGSKIGDIFVLSNFKSIERKQEEPHFKRWAEIAGLSVWQPSNSFEGDGDLLSDPSKSTYFMGHGFRTSSETAPELRDRCNINVQPLKLVDPRFYHLDTCFCPLENGKLLAYMGAFDKESVGVLTEIYGINNIINVSEEEAIGFSCNAVLIKNTLIVPHILGGITKERIDGCGLIVENVDLSEFKKSGGAAKCLTLKIS